MDDAVSSSNIEHFSGQSMVWKINYYRLEFCCFKGHSFPWMGKMSKDEVFGPLVGVRRRSTPLKGVLTVPTRSGRPPLFDVRFVLSLLSPSYRVLSEPSCFCPKLSNL